VFSASSPSAYLSTPTTVSIVPEGAYLAELGRCFQSGSRTALSCCLGFACPAEALKSSVHAGSLFLQSGVRDFS
jgi:hypothetical protein